MTDESRKAELVSRLKRLSDEIDEIKSELDRLNETKEKAYQKKESVGKEIAQRIRGLTVSKKQRNEYTDEVQDLKKKRDSLNDRIKKEIEEIKTLKSRHRDLSKNIKGNPVRLLKQIEQLEYKLQTTPMEFSKEQALTKKIKDLKKEAEGSKEASDVWKSIKEKSKHIDELKKEANSYHSMLQELADKSQEHHEEILDVSGEIDGLRQKEEGATRNFVDKKKDWQEANQRLKEKLDELRKVKKELGQDVEEEKRQLRTKTKKTLQEKEKEVQEKLKQKKKLTTEDLLILQGADQLDDLDASENGSGKKKAKEPKKLKKPIKEE